MAPPGGKTIRIIVGMPPGGGVDSYARLVQRHLGRFLAGAPAIVVQNMPGAGSLRSVMAVANSPDDVIGPSARPCSQKRSPRRNG